MKDIADLSAVLPQLKASGLVLRQHQIEGIETIVQWIKDNHGGIMADEMGLGKTCQAVITLALIAKSYPKAKFLVICPLSVIEHWENELMRFGCGILKLFVYKGYKDTREKLRPRFTTSNWNVCLTTYNYFRMDESFFKFPIDVVVVDEAHSVKSQQSQLHQLVRQKEAKFHLLLTGTPIQNDLFEFYSLLSLCNNNAFDESDEARDEFFDKPKKELEKRLKEATEKYVLRRLKAEVCKDLPSSEEVILLHGLTNFQKQLYNAVLVSNHSFFEEKTAQKQSLMNVLAQLRKAVAHPYLFPGVEPEPFVEGEHLFTASGKFMVLDKLLAFLKTAKHRCLIFSQYARNLEILADALSFRGYTYEYLDGSSKPEERFQSIENFQKEDSDVFCFLISTKAGGQGLTLTAADTVIFLDSDYNPQNDLQAAARCHRIGQDKPVKVIRLLAEHTIDNVIRKRAAGKLKLSDFILDDKSESLSSSALREVLLSDLAKLNEVPDSTEAYSKLLTDDYFIEHIGKTDKNSHWINQNNNNIAQKVDEDSVELFPRASSASRLTKADETAFERIKLEVENSNDEVLKKAVKDETPLSDRTNKKKDAADLDEAWAQARARAKAKREAQEKKRQEAKQKLWNDNNYKSNSVITLGKILSRKHDPEPTGRLYRVVGTIAAPTRDQSDPSTEAWLLHSIDTGGKWGRGGLFSVLDNLSMDISTAYHKAGEMQDLHCGDAHFIDSVVDQHQSEAKTLEPTVDLDEDKTKTQAPEKLTQKLSVLLMVTQNLRDRHRLCLNESSLTRCFKAIADFALTRDVLPSIHMPCIWYGIPTLNERSVRKLIVKGLCKKGLDVYIYRYKKNYTPNYSRKNTNKYFSTARSSTPPAKKRKVDDDEESEKYESEEDDEDENDVDFNEDSDLDGFIVDDDEEIEYEDDYDDDEFEKKTKAKPNKLTAVKKPPPKGAPKDSVFDV